MANLPADVLLSIFPLLVQRDQLECMTVCRQWHNVIYQRTLFRVIFINCREQLNQFIEKVEKDRSLGAKVEQLTIQMNLDWNYHGTNFADLFQNVREFTVINTEKARCDIKFIQSGENNSLRDRIKKVLENESSTNTKTLLKSGVCKNLTFISVKGQLGARVNSLISLLTNAPALETLELEEFVITFEDLESLHENAPLLSSLKLQSARFNDPSLPPNIKPATSLKKFRSCDFHFSPYSDRNPHLVYIQQKYTHLELLELDLFPIDVFDYYPPSSDEQDKRMIPSFMKAFGPGLKTLQLTIVDHEDDSFAETFDFDILDECGCQIKTLDLGFTIKTDSLERLTKTSQVQYIQALLINRVANYRDQFTSLDLVRRFTVLKDLTLTSLITTLKEKGQTLCLAELLKSLSGTQVEIVRLYNIELILDTDSTINHVCSSVNDLTLSNVKYEPGTDALISKAFPNLKRMKLDKLFKKSGESFNLPNIDLTYLEIINLSNKVALPVVIKTLRNNERRLYQANKKASFYRDHRSDVQKEVSILPFVSSQPFNGSDDIPMVKIVCNSVYNFFMMNSGR